MAGTVKFIKTAADTGGELLEMEATYNTAVDSVPEHYHPYEERSILRCGATALPQPYAPGSCGSLRDRSKIVPTAEMTPLPPAEPSVPPPRPLYRLPNHSTLRHAPVTISSVSRLYHCVA